MLRIPCKVHLDHYFANIVIKTCLANTPLTAIFESKTTLAMMKPFCVHCECYVSHDSPLMKVTDMSQEMVLLVEQNIKRQSNENDVMCDNCFTNVTQYLENKNEVPLKIELKDEEPMKVEVYYACKSESSSEGSNDSSVSRSSSNWKCVLCRITITLRTSFVIREGAEKNAIALEIYPREIMPGNRLCRNCFKKVQINSPLQSPYDHEVTIDTKKKKAIKNKNDNEVNIDTKKKNKNECSVSIPLPNYRRAISSRRHCFVNKCPNKECRLIPKYLRKVLLESYKFYVRPCTRICSEHVKEYYRDWSFLDDEVYKNDFNSTEVIDMLEILHDTET